MIASSLSFTDTVFISTRAFEANQAVLAAVAIADLITGDGFDNFASLDEGRQEAILRQFLVLTCSASMEIARIRAITDGPALEDATPAYPTSAANSHSLHSLGLKSWVAPRLRSNGITTVGQLTSLTALDLLKMPNVGKKTMREIGLALARNGLSLSVGGAA